MSGMQLHAATRRRLLPALTLAVMLLPAGVAPAAAADATDTIITGQHAGALALPGGGALSTIAQIHVPPGIWSITANGVFLNGSTDGRTVRCRLVAGGSIDDLRAGLQGSGGVLKVLPLLSHLAVVVGGPNGGDVRWRCASIEGTAGDVTAGHLELTAIAGRALNSLDLATGIATSHGSGAPHVRTGSLAGPVDVPAGGDYSDVATMPVPPGTWFVTAKAVARASGAATSVRCGMTPIHDQAQLRLASASHALEVLPMAWQGSMTIDPPGGAIHLRCESPGGAAGDVRLESIRMTAFQVTAPMVKAVPPTPPPSSAAAQLVFHDAEQLAHGYPVELTLPNGNWAILATAVLEDAVDYPSEITCGLLIDDVGPFDTFAAAKNGVAGSEFGLHFTRAETIAAVGGSGTVRLTCDVGFVDNLHDFVVRWDRLSAIRATSLGRQDF